MNTVNSTAFANLKQNKGKNILVGIAIFLTTILLLVIPSVGFGIMDVEVAAINELYPTYHVMFRNVDEKTAQNLSIHRDIESIGLRQDVAQSPVTDGAVYMIYLDQESIALNKTTLESGEWPKEADEIAVTQGMLDAMGIKAKIGDTVPIPYQVILPEGLDYQKEADFRICGIVKTNSDQNETKSYMSLVSRAFMEQEQPTSQRAYRAMLRITGADSMTRYEIQDIYEKIGEDFNIPEGDIVPNSNYLRANYVDPAFYAGVVIILLIVVFAGVITIYSIYYISLMYKVQEYGKLKALGTTKRQIRQIVFREGMLIACIAIPIGLIVGSICTIIATRYLTSAFAIDNVLNETINKILEEHASMLLNPWIYLMAAAIALATVALSLFKPMRIAAKISPVEAMRYDGGFKTRKKERRGHEELNLIRLTGANLSRNKKRTAITITTLGLTGILFLVISTVLSCADSKEIARESIFDDLTIHIVSSDGDKMHPERSWSEIQKNNPLSDEFEAELMDVPGVEKITKMNMVSAEFKDVYEGDVEDGYLKLSIIGIPDEYGERLEDSIIEGNCTFEELLSGNKIIIDKNYLRFVSEETGIGDKVQILYEYGGKTVEREFEIAAIADMPKGLGSYCWAALPYSVIDEMCEYNMNRSWSVDVDGAQLDKAEQKIRKLVSQEEFLDVQSYEDEVAYNRKNTELTSQICYVFMVVLGGIGIMNLINTMINSIYVRRRELGIMQAIGLSEKQMVRMLQMEGLFYTVGSLAVSLGIGSALGYAAYLYASDGKMLGIVNYHFPTVQALVLILIVAFIQLLLTYLIMKSFRKQSMIERIRFSE